MNKKNKYLIFFIGLFLVGVIVFLSLVYQVYWGYIFTIVPIWGIMRIVEHPRFKKK
jgi:hypothetical protein